MSRMPLCGCGHGVGFHAPECPCGCPKYVLAGAVGNPLDDPAAMARATEALQVSADMPHDQRAAYIIGAALDSEAPPFNPDPELSDSLRGKYQPLRDLREQHGDEDDRG